MKRLIVHFDGGCHNKKIGAGAAILFDQAGNELNHKAIFLSSPYVTVQIAEYAGLACALWLARKFVIIDGPANIKILGDSELVVKQVSGVYQCRKEHLRPWLEHVLLLINDLKETGSEVTVALFPRSGRNQKRRSGNSQADALATACMKGRRDLP